MNIKILLRCALCVYTGILLIDSGQYTAFRLCVNIVASLVSILATLAFILYIRSRKPVDTSLLHYQMLMYFRFRLLVYPYWMISSLLGYRMQNNSDEPLWMELVLRRTAFSYNSSRIVILLNGTMLTLISAVRALLFLSPATFKSTSKRISKWCTSIIMLMVLSFEVIMSTQVYTTDKCLTDQNGIQLNAFPYFGTNNTLPDFPTEKTCNIFPLFKILALIFLSLEGIRFMLAVVKKYQSLKRKHIMMKSDKTPGQDAEPEARVKYSPKIHNPQKNDTNEIAPREEASVGTSNLMIMVQPVELGLSKREEAFVSLTTRNINAFKSCSLIGLNHAIEMQENGKASTIFNQTEPTRQLNCGVQTKTNQTRLSQFGRTSRQVSPDLSNPRTESQHQDTETTALAQSDSWPRLSRAQLNSFVRSTSLPNLSDLPKSKADKSEACQISCQPPATREQTTQTSDTNTILNYVKILTLRAYTLIIVLAVLYLLSHLLPCRSASFRWQQLDLIILDLHFVPVFWLFLDKDAFWHTQKIIKQAYLDIKVKLSGF